MPSTATAILDGLSTSVAVKAPCRTVATSNITLSGLQTISGYATAEDDRVLVKGQTNSVDNGIYMASTGSWTRAKDADGARDLVQGTRVIIRSTTADGVEYELTTANPIVIGTTAQTWTLRYGANATYDQTEAEIAAGVTPVGYQYPEGNAFRYMSATQIADVISLAATVDVTTAIQSAISVGGPVFFPPGRYLVTESLTKTDAKRFHWYGVPGQSVLVNKASANKPTILITDCQYWTIEDIVVSGRAGFPNKGIVITTAGGQTSCFWKIKNVGLEPNGNGIELTKTNTNRIEGCEYWPSGALGVGSTADSGVSGTRKHAIFVDAAVSGQYCNELHIEGCNLIGVDEDIAGHANIKIGENGGGCQGINIWDCELEGAQCVVEISGAYNLDMKGCFVEGAALTLSSCRYSSVEHCYNWEGISFVGCVNTFLMNHIQGPVTTSFTIDNTSTHCGAINAEFQNAPSDSGTGSIFINWTVAGTRQADRMGLAGVRERGRSIAIGEWATRSFTAGDFTATTGTWTVATGDRLTDKYSLNGKTMTYAFNVATSTTASSAVALHILIPGGFTAGTTDVYFEYTYSMDNGTTTSKGLGRVIAGDTKITLYRDIATTAFSNVTDLLLVRGTVTFEIA